MKDGQLVRKIYVKSEKDLPIDNKKYDVFWKGNDFHRMHGWTMKRYFNDIDWYLQPEINCNICGKNKIDIYPICVKCWDDVHPKQQVGEQESKSLLTAEEMVNENFKGLDSLINDEDLCQWYKDLIKTCLEEYANQFKTK